MTTDEFLQQASGNVVIVRSPQVEELRNHVVGADVTVVALEPGLIEVHGLTAKQIGEAAARHKIVLHELTPQQVSLEEAFMDLTRDDVEFKTAAA
jgi:ABC-2 type transport system ATP-binding protein